MGWGGVGWGGVGWGGVGWGGVGLGSGEAELTIWDLQNGLSATMNSSAEGAEMIFRGPQRCQKQLLGVKNDS